MKISVFRDLLNNVYKCRIETSDFSQRDLQLMEDYGEPTINIGGDFHGTRPDFEGTADLSAGHDWESTPESFIITAGGEGPDELTVDTDCADLASVVEALNTLFADNGYDTLVQAYAVDDMSVGIRTLKYGSDQSVTLAAGGTGAFMTTTGITPGTQTGTGSPRFVLSDDYRKLMSESPFTYAADARDEQFSGAAELQAELWIETMVDDIKAELDILRANTDDFTGETVETY